MPIKSMCIIATAVASISSSPVLAKMRLFGTAGGYEVAGQASTRDEQGGCIATYEYDGQGSTKTTIFRTLKPDVSDVVWLTVVNFEWSAKENQMFALKYSFDQGEYDRDAKGVVRDTIYKGFMSGFPAEEFLSVFARSNSLHITFGDKVVDRLKLDGSTEGIALFKKCWDWAVGTERAAQAERARFRGIPRDPFAPSEKN